MYIRRNQGIAIDEKERKEKQNRRSPHEKTQNKSNLLVSDIAKHTQTDPQTAGKKNNHLDS